VRVDKFGRWELYDSLESGLVPVHFCPTTKKIQANGKDRFVKFTLHHKAVYDRDTKLIYCPKCYSKLPENMMAMVKLSGSQKELEYHSYGGWNDYNEHPEAHEDGAFSWMVKK
jgi:hypothetical protein